MKSECDRDLLRIATVGNRWELPLSPAKLMLHFLTLKKRNFQQRRVYLTIYEVMDGFCPKGSATDRWRCAVHPWEREPDYIN